MDSLPLFLYKYLPPERVDVLERQLLRFTPLGAFNDPFEGRPSVTTLAPESEVREMLRDLVPSEIKRAYEWLPPDVRQNISFEMFESMSASLTQVNEVEMLAAFSGMKNDVQKLLYAKIDEFVGVLALSEVPDSLLMWSHYAASHTGLVLGFDPRHPYFNQRKSESDELRHLRRVMYRETRPRGAMTSLEGTDMFFVKSGHWAYEREWRMLRPLQDADQVVSCEPGTIHLFKFPSTIVKEIVIGARATENTRSSIINFVQSGLFSEDVRIIQSCPDDNHFMLSFKDVVV